MIFGNIHLFPIFMELTLHRQKTPFSYFNVFRDPNVNEITWKFTGVNIWKEEDMWAKEANKRRPEAQTGVAHVARYCGRVGPTRLALVALLPSIFSPPTSSWPKNAYKRSPTSFSGTSAAETQKHRNGDQELQIGGGKLRRGATGVVCIFSIDFSTVSMMKRE